MQEKEVERRVYVRLEARLPVSYYAIGRHPHWSMTRDISAQGMRFITEMKMTPSDTLGIQIEPTEAEESIFILAQVAWSKPCESAESQDSLSFYETGVRFIRVHPDRSALLNYSTGDSK